MDLHVAASRVDEFRRVATTDWCPEDRLVKSITTREPLGWQALYGEALHECIQTGLYEWTSKEGQTVKWKPAIVDECRASWPRPCIFERRCQKDYVVNGHRVTVSGRTDGSHGVGIIEGKTKFGFFALEDYTSSLQWKFYLDMLPWARYVEYRVHEIGGMYTDKRTGQMRIAKGGVRLEDIHVWRMWRQDGIGDDIALWLGEFVAWAIKKGLAKHLVPWQQRAA